MEVVIRTSLIGVLFGTFGTMLGGILGLGTKQITEKTISMVLSLAAGLMSSIVCFELIPQSMIQSNIIICITGILIGTVIMKISELIVEKKCINFKKNSYLKTGFIIALGLTFHNIPEGLAIGTGMEIELKFGLSVALAILLHDIPEGVSMSIPLKKGGMKSGKILLFVLISGMATGLGSLVGALIGNVNENLIGISMAIAAGAMLYVVTAEIVPQVNKIECKLNSAIQIIGFIIGLIVSIVC